MKTIKFKKLLPGARLPEKATSGAAAYDLYIPENTLIKPGRQIIPLGFAMELPEEHEALIDPRSGFSSKGMEGYEVGDESRFSLRNLWMDPCSSPRPIPEIEKSNKTFVCTDADRFDCDVIEGKIDSDYRDGVGVIVHNRGSRTFQIKAGTRIAQMTIHKVETVKWEEVEELSETSREGGFGSTGTK